MKRLARMSALCVLLVSVAIFGGLARGAAGSHTTRPGGHWASTLAGPGMPAVQAHPPRPAPTPPWQKATIDVGAGPVGVDLDPGTHTLYVANTGEDTLSVVDARHCNARNADRCTPIATVTVGAGPLYVVVDAATHTVYTSLIGDTAVAVVNGAICNADHTTGCGQAPLRVTTAGSPAGLTLEPGTHTLYVGDANDGPVSVVDTATCNAVNTGGCGQTPVQTAALGDTPAVDASTHTAYASDFNDGVVSLFDTATCNAAMDLGCGALAATIPIAGPPSQAAVAGHTLYIPVVGPHPGDLAMLDTSTCNAAVASDCSLTTTDTGSAPVEAIADSSTGTVYVLNGESNSIAMLDATSCNAATTSGCGATHAIGVGVDPGLIVLDPSTHTLYASSQDTNAVWVLDASHCNARHTEGCTLFAPTTGVGVGPEDVALNPQTQTLYVANGFDTNTVSVVDASACNLGRLNGCGQSWPKISVGTLPDGVVVDPTTDTVYVANLLDNTVSVIDGSTCNAHVHTGCSQTPEAIPVGSEPSRLAFDPATATVYVPNLLDGTVSVIDASTCNARASASCNQTPPTMAVNAGGFPEAVAVNDATHTVYTSDFGIHSVSVFDGSTCNAKVQSGCGQTPAQVVVGHGPYSIAVDPSTNTIYDAAILEGYVSVIDGSTCDAQNTSGCGQTPPFVNVGGQPWGMVVDSAHHTAYVSSIADSAVSEINLSSCRGGHTEGCHASILPVRVGGFPNLFALDQATGTGYVANLNDDSLSLFKLNGS